ncbi:hypothetical protein CAOG_08850 [Capsaspora owczarzaki ATCC 30864]|uniref:hypothetical protein n=1 Tax=Capsaspora owczarzaki (strain ATCC 30864) TaxID=595528 RepID=UPI0003526DE1|nr:hypothetical protein CAOG_08850 [Capsaspora owczarzaki ATCC 30864]|eukprot:XP_011270504.1 hypothetical protein CAOG_08850 [Capsaspora owczarzaki ATCC 30864]
MNTPSMSLPMSSVGSLPASLMSPAAAYLGPSLGASQQVGQSSSSLTSAVSAQLLRSSDKSYLNNVTSPSVGGGDSAQPMLQKCEVHIMDGHIEELSVEPTIQAAALFEMVAQRVGLVDPIFFGLKYRRFDGEFVWVELTKLAQEHSWTDSKQPRSRRAVRTPDASAATASNASSPTSVDSAVLPGTSSMNDLVWLFHLEVKCYPLQPLSVEVQSRHLIFLQLRTALSSGDLICWSEEQCYTISSLLIQAERSDYYRGFPVAYLRDPRLSPKLYLDASGHPVPFEARLEQLSSRHAQLVGTTPRAAEDSVLQTVSSFPNYGHEFHADVGAAGSARDPATRPLTLGIRLQGLSLFPAGNASTPISQFHWREIQQIEQRKDLLVIECSGLSASQGSRLSLACRDRRTAKLLLRSCIDQNLLCRLFDMKDAPSPRTHPAPSHPHHSRQQQSSLLVAGPSSSSQSQASPSQSQHQHQHQQQQQQQQQLTPSAFFEANMVADANHHGSTGWLEVELITGHHMHLMATPRGIEICTPQALASARTRNAAFDPDTAMPPLTAIPWNEVVSFHLINPELGTFEIAGLRDAPQQLAEPASSPGVVVETVSIILHLVNVDASTALLQSVIEVHRGQMWDPVSHSKLAFSVQGQLARLAKSLTRILLVQSQAPSMMHAVFSPGNGPFSPPRSTATPDQSVLPAPPSLPFSPADSATAPSPSPSLVQGSAVATVDSAEARKGLSVDGVVRHPSLPSYETVTTTTERRQAEQQQQQQVGADTTQYASHDDPSSSGPAASDGQQNGHKRLGSEAFADDPDSLQPAPPPRYSSLDDATGRSVNVGSRLDPPSTSRLHQETRWAPPSFHPIPHPGQLYANSMMSRALPSYAQLQQQQYQQQQQLQMQSPPGYASPGYNRPLPPPRPAPPPYSAVASASSPAVHYSTIPRVAPPQYMMLFPPGDSSSPQYAATPAPPSYHSDHMTVGYASRPPPMYGVPMLPYGQYSGLSAYGTPMPYPGSPMASWNLASNSPGGSHLQSGAWVPSSMIYPSAATPMPMTPLAPLDPPSNGSESSNIHGRGPSIGGTSGLADSPADVKPAKGRSRKKKTAAKQPDAPSTNAQSGASVADQHGHSSITPVAGAGADLGQSSITPGDGAAGAGAAVEGATDDNPGTTANPLGPRRRGRPTKLAKAARDAALAAAAEQAAIVASQLADEADASADEEQGGNAIASDSPAGQDLPASQPAPRKSRANAAATVLNVITGQPVVVVPCEDSAGVKRFPCPHCEIMASTMAHLRAHMRSHSGERPFACAHDGCGRRFLRREELIRHLRSHTNERPFKCSICTRPFTRSDHLAKHMGTHADVNEFVCKVETCKKAMAKVETLVKHLQLHMSEVPNSKVAPAHLYAVCITAAAQLSGTGIEELRQSRESGGTAHRFSRAHDTSVVTQQDVTEFLAQWNEDRRVAIEQHAQLLAARPSKPLATAGAANTEEDDRTDSDPGNDVNATASDSATDAEDANES